LPVADLRGGLDPDRSERGLVRPWKKLTGAVAATDFQSNERRPRSRIWGALEAASPVLGAGPIRWCLLARPGWPFSFWASNLGTSTDGAVVDVAELFTLAKQAATIANSCTVAEPGSMSDKACFRQLSFTDRLDCDRTWHEGLPTLPRSPYDQRDRQRLGHPELLLAPL